MLERLTPEQRAVFVLRVAFEMDYAEIATALGTTAASTRQMMKKARLRMGQPARFPADVEASRALADRFADACNRHDQDALVSLLAEDCRFLSDGGGIVNAARRPVVGRHKVARMLHGLRRKYGLTLSARAESMGPSPLLVATAHGVVGMAALDVAPSGWVDGVFFQWNPKKVRIRALDGLADTPIRPPITPAAAGSSYPHQEDEP